MLLNLMERTLPNFRQKKKFVNTKRIFKEFSQSLPDQSQKKTQMPIILFVNTNPKKEDEDFPDLQMLKIFFASTKCLNSQYLNII